MVDMYLLTVEKKRSFLIDLPDTLNVSELLKTSIGLRFKVILFYKRHWRLVLDSC